MIKMIGNVFLWIPDYFLVIECNLPVRQRYSTGSNLLPLIASPTPQDRKCIPVYLFNHYLDFSYFVSTFLSSYTSNCSSTCSTSGTLIVLVLHFDLFKFSVSFCRRCSLIFWIFHHLPEVGNLLCVPHKNNRSILKSPMCLAGEKESYFEQKKLKILFKFSGTWQTCKSKLWTPNFKH